MFVVQVYVRRRPYFEHFLQAMSKIYEIVVSFAFEWHFGSPFDLAARQLPSVGFHSLTKGLRGPLAKHFGS